jgi:hypothetical protein
MKETAFYDTSMGGMKKKAKQIGYFITLTPMPHPAVS